MHGCEDGEENTAKNVFLIWKSKFQSNYAHKSTSVLGFAEGEELQTEPAEKWTSAGFAEALSL